MEIKDPSRLRAAAERAIPDAESQGRKTGKIFLFTGLSGAGRSSLAEAVKARIGSKGNLVLLDGDVMRKGVCSDLGFSEEDRMENLRRCGEIAKMLASQGINVLMAMIAPYEKGRRKLINNNPGDVYIVHIDCPLEICIFRDPKKNYQKALGGHLAGYTGLAAPYEAPENPDLRIDTSRLELDRCVEIISEFVTSRIDACRNS